jgi:hypothetical protein
VLASAVISQGILILIGSILVQLAAHHSGAVAQEFIFNTCQAVPLANLVATQSVHQ